TWGALRHGYGTQWQTGSAGRGCLPRIRHPGRSRCVQAVIQGFQEVPPRRQGLSVKVGSPLFPPQACAAPWSPSRLAQRTTQVWHLIHPKRQPHQRGTQHREVVIAVAAMVRAMIALLVQRLERLICDAPARPCSLHEPIHRAWVDPYIGAPAQMLDFPVSRRLPALDASDPQPRLGGIERPITDQTKPMGHPALVVCTL